VNKIAMRVERKRGIGIIRVSDDLPIPRWQQPGAAPSGLNTRAEEPARSAKQRQYTAQTQVTQRTAPFTWRGETTAIERSKLFVDSR
jgi:hypothetical protein